MSDIELTEEWENRIKHNFITDNIHLSKIIQAEWKLSGRTYLLSCTKTPRKWCRWLLKEKWDATTIERKKYCIIIELDGCVKIPLEIEDSWFSVIVTDTYKTLFYDVKKDRLLRPQREDMMFRIWDHIKMIIEDNYGKIVASKTKSMGNIMRQVMDEYKRSKGS